MNNSVFESYKDIHKGKRVFLIANGPSLADTNLDLLEGEITIAMNRVSMLYDKFTKWRPTYYLFSSTNVKPHNPWAQEWLNSVTRSIKEDTTTSFIASLFKKYIDPGDYYPQVKWFDSLSEKKPQSNGDISSDSFSTNVVDRIDKSGTTMNLALQLSYHMGFTEIIVVGADLGWSGDRGSKNDPNHFDKSYRADIPSEKVYKINNQMRNIHSLAYSHFEKKDSTIQMYNASLKSVLDVYPMIDYEKYILENKVEYLSEKFMKAKSFWDKEPQFGGASGTYL